jgi:rare lipoprotein A
MICDRTDPGAGFSLRQGLSVSTLLRIAGVTAIALTVANCSKGVGGIDSKYGVAASPRVVRDGEPVPKGGGRNMVGKPYTVAGRTYVPSENPSYTKEGLASWYGSNFHGRLTANGEVFDRASIAAAHTTMPLPSYARVTNMQNGHSMIVRVNDRGPYHGNRVIDVSERAAEALGFRRSGTAPVRVEYVGRASTNGSDDRILLASLRTDGGPASLNNGRPTMLAEADPAPVPVRQPATKPRKMFRSPSDRLPGILQLPRRPAPSIMRRCRPSVPSIWARSQALERRSAPPRFPMHRQGALWWLGFTMPRLKRPAAFRSRLPSAPSTGLNS